MEERQRGISLVTLAVTVVISLILAGITVYTGMEIIQSARTQTIHTNLLLIQAKVKTISEKADFEGNTQGYVGSPVQDEIASKVGFLGNKEKARFLTKEDLNAIGLGKVEWKEGYLVDYETEEIYYVKGYKGKDNNTYYRLSQMKQVTEE